MRSHPPVLPLPERHISSIYSKYFAPSRESFLSAVFSFSCTIQRLLYGGNGDSRTFVWYNTQAFHAFCGRSNMWSTPWCFNYCSVLCQLSKRIFHFSAPPFWHGDLYIEEFELFMNFCFMTASNLPLKAILTKNLSTSIC